MKHTFAWMLSLLLAALPALAADGIPDTLPQGSYVDKDPAAIYFPVLPGRRAELRKKVSAAIQKNPRNVSALVHRAHFFQKGDDPVRARRDFDAAMAAAEPGSMEERHVLWSRGWASYDLEQYREAYADWQRAVTLHGGKPYWAPYSLALLYWTVDRQDTALAWYDAAVSAEPKWGDADAMADKIHNWSPPQQARIRAVFAAWSARRGEEKDVTD